MSELLSGQMLLSGRIKKTPPTAVSPDRYQWITLQETEPDLGVPQIGGSLLLSSTTGTREWSDTVSIDTAGNLVLDSEIRIGSVETDNYSRLRHVVGSNSGYGFSGVSGTYTVLVNEELSVAQAVFLGDVDTGSSGTLFGVSILNGSDSTPSTGIEPWIPRLTLSGEGKLTIVGPLEITVGQINTTSTTADIFNSSATTVNIGSAATSVNIGAATGTTSVKNNLNIAGNVQLGPEIIFGNFQDDDYSRLHHVSGQSSGYGFDGVSNTYTVLINEEDDDAQAIFLGDVKSDSNGTLFGISVLDSSDSTPSTGIEPWIPRLRLSGAGKLTIVGPLEIASGQITTTSTTASIFNTDATTVNIGGDATSVNIASTEGTTFVNNNLTVGGTVIAASFEISGNPGVDLITTITRSITLTQDWQDTGIKSTDLPTGTYIVQLYANDVSVGGSNNNEYYSGTMSWYSGQTGSSVELPTDEIVLHRAGASSDAGLYLRTFRTAEGNPDNLRLQIYSNFANPSAANYVFKFRRII
jgi:hypothetical protein